MIKNYTLAVLSLLFCVVVAEAQQDFFTVTKPLGQGDILLGGSIYASQSNFDDANSINRQFSTSVSPKVQVFLSDNMVASLAVPLSFNRNRNDVEQIDVTVRGISSHVSIYPALRFFMPIGERLYAFVEGFSDIGWGLTRVEFQPQNQVNTDSQFMIGAGLTGGASFLINDHLLLEGSIVGLNYYWRNIDPAGGNRLNARSGFWLNPSRPTLSLSYRIPAR